MKVETLREWLYYDPEENGSSLRWRRSPNVSIKVGTRAGYRHTEGYWRVGLLGSSCPAHIIVWALAHGSISESQIDHIDTNKGNNRIENLRLAPNNEKDNGQNRAGANKNNKTGCLGVSKYSDADKYRARITVAGKSIFLGSFNTLAEAKSAYIAAKIVHHPFSVLEKHNES